MKIVEDLKSYLKKPVYRESFEKIPLGHFMFTVLCYFILAMPPGILTYFLTKIFNITHKELNFPFYRKVLIVILVAPVLEELLFRLIYVFNKRNIIIVTVACGSMTIMRFFTSEAPKSSYSFP